MKRLLLAVALVAVIFLLAGCTGDQLVPLSGGDVSTIYVDGRQAAFTESDGLSVAVSGTRVNNELYLHLGYRNNTGERVEANPEELRIEASDRAGNVKHLFAYPAAQYIARLESQRAAELVVKTMVTLSTDHTDHEYGHGHGPHGPYYWEKTETHGPDLGDWFRLAHDAERSKWDIAAVRRMLLARTTLFPGDSAEGIVVVEYDPRYSEHFTVGVPFGGRVYRMEFAFERK